MVNMVKTKVLIARPGLDKLPKSSKHPLAVCLLGVGTNSIFCESCSSRVHKRSSGTLKSDTTFRCKRCTGLAGMVYGRPMIEVTVGKENPQVVPTFCFLGHCLFSGGGCDLASITRCHVIGIFNELLPIHTSRGRFYNSCARCAMPAKLEPQPHLICIACNGMSVFDLLDVRRHHQGLCQLTRSPGGDAARRSAESIPHPSTQMAWPCQR